jgi:hypothetical protein
MCTYSAGSSIGTAVLTTSRIGAKSHHSCSSDPSLSNSPRIRGSESHQHDPIKPRHVRPGDRRLQRGELVSEQGDFGEQRPSRAKQVHCRDASRGD